MILTNGAGDKLWDFGERETLAVYGVVGAGKTILLRHVALSWAETGMVRVVVGAHFPEEWDDMSDIVHVASLENAIEYGRFMSRYPQENVVCVIDDADRAYSGPLNSAERYGVAWTFASHRPLSDSGPMTNLGVGRQSEDDLRRAFGPVGAGRNYPVEERVGTAVRSDDAGAVVKRPLARDLVTDIRSRIAVAPTKMPLRTLPKRFWY